jgi:glycosyltransferase involved in cell wall biosynthesis
MKLVLTVLARDEADVIDAQVAFHLNAGVDYVIATDNNSRDGTTEILEAYARDGVLHLIREPAEGLRQGLWVTRMARLAAAEFGADWVINSDADEFWCSSGAPLKTILAEVPRRFDTVRAVMRNFVPRPGESGLFAERMNVRLVPGRVTQERYRVHPFHAQDKVLHRAHPEVTLTAGNHDARWPSSVDLRGFWHFEVLHFPMRTAEQCVLKWRNYERYGYAGYNVLTDFDAREYYESLLVNDAELARGLESGMFAVDERLRDALRTIRGNNGKWRTQELSFPAHTTLEAAALAADIAAGSDRDAAVKAESRLHELETRVSAVERSLGRRFRSLMRR